MKFLLVMIQDSEGCSYSIRCGLDIKTIEADTRKDAISKSFKLMASDWEDSPAINEDIDRASLYEIRSDEIIVPLDEYKKQLERQEEYHQLSETRKAEYQEYQRLKALYEDGNST